MRATEVTRQGEVDPTESASPSVSQHRRFGLLQGQARIPLWRLPAVVAAVLGVLPAARPLRDPDIWWHVRLGDYIRHEGVPHHELWSYTHLGDPWHPTAWLTDIGLSILHESGGWRAIVVYKVVASAAILTMLYRQVMPRARAEIATPVFVLAVAVLTLFMTERPQLISFVLVLVVGPWARQLATRGQLRILPWVAVTYVWCNLHGMWVLGPSLLCLGAFSWAVQCKFSWPALRVLRRSLLAAAVATLTTAVTPVGPGLTLQPFSVHAIGAEITEWQPTSLTGNAPLAFGLLLACLVASWAVTRVASTGLLLFSLGVIAFSFLAVRNVAPATLLLAPVVADAAGTALVPALRGRRESDVPGWVATATAGLLAGVVATTALARPAVDPTIPWPLVDRLAAAPAPKHVVVDFTVSGLITGLVPSASVAMDTRVDNFSDAYVHDYLSMLRMGPHWQRTLQRADPDYALLLTGSSLAQELRQRRGWATLGTDRGFVLLRRPRS